jgi:hypothetical protein
MSTLGISTTISAFIVSPSFLAKHRSMKLPTIRISEGFLKLNVVLPGSGTGAGKGILIEDFFSKCVIILDSYKRMKNRAKQ